MAEARQTKAMDAKAAAARAAKTKAHTYNFPKESLQVESLFKAGLHRPCRSYVFVRDILNSLDLAGTQEIYSVEQKRKWDSMAREGLRHNWLTQPSQQRLATRGRGSELRRKVRAMQAAADRAEAEAELDEEIEAAKRAEWEQAMATIEHWQAQQPPEPPPQAPPWRNVAAQVQQWQAWAASVDGPTASEAIVRLLAARRGPLDQPGAYASQATSSLPEVRLAPQPGGAGRMAKLQLFCHKVAHGRPTKGESLPSQYPHAEICAGSVDTPSSQTNVPGKQINLPAPSPRLSSEAPSPEQGALCRPPPCGNLIQARSLQRKSLHKAQRRMSRRRRQRRMKGMSRQADIQTLENNKLTLPGKGIEWLTNQILLLHANFGRSTAGGRRLCWGR